ncbi:PilZ domain-containing protein [Marinicrinis sediminis]|uniref:PilZ domain-containing protein n=1 Tax=Marinicrinis sediminis TaxID=1652465 RepID=A0ABW5RAW4_9BACL
MDTFAFLKNKEHAMSTEYEHGTAGILLDSRTVVETRDYLTTGILTYAEGDIIEIELSDYRKFKLGDVVKLSIYSLGGIHTVHSSVVAIDNGVVIVLNPPENQKKFLNKREHPRVDIEEKGHITKVFHPQKDLNIASPIQIHIQNISIGGVGFLATGQPSLTLYETRVELQLHIGHATACDVEVVRHEETEGGIYYGAKMVHFPQARINALRAYILTKQIQYRAVSRKQEFRSRLAN